MPPDRGGSAGRLTTSARLRGPLKVDQDELTSNAELANITAAVGANEVVLARDTHDVATARGLPLVDPAPTGPGTAAQPGP
uniref:Uncharacterized protein n=1 Tax=Streptomyces sp. F12 TaxID=1436084 RepID=V9Z8U4_9ACTN|nr:hypothetical protein [Streptomyces sp. F12]AHE40424.1 hypothetical protein pFRL6_337c [Streptomyces sp. F12]